MNQVQPIGETVNLFFSHARKHNFSDNVSDVHDNIRDAVTHIIQGNNELKYIDSVLIESILRFTKHGALHFSDKPVNERPEENEIKVLNCFQDSKLEKFLKQAATLTFQGIVDDTYFDYIDAQNKFPDQEIITLKDRKISLRIRNKLDDEGTYKMYYTLKRKLKELSEQQKSRICLESEFEINNPQLAIDNLHGLELTAFKRKYKYRQSYKLAHTTNTIDIDTYVDINGKPLFEPFIEFEVENIEDAYDLIELCGLTMPHHTILTSGSTGTFKHEGVDYESMSNSEGILLPKKSWK